MASHTMQTENVFVQMGLLKWNRISLSSPATCFGWCHFIIVEGKGQVVIETFFLYTSFNLWATSESLAHQGAQHH